MTHIKLFSILACAGALAGCVSVPAPAIVSLDDRTFQMSEVYTAADLARGDVEDRFTYAVGWHAQRSKVCPIPFYMNAVRRWATPTPSGGVIMNAVFTCDLTKRY